MKHRNELFPTYDIAHPYIENTAYLLTSDHTETETTPDPHPTTPSRVCLEEKPNKIYEFHFGNSW